MTQTQRNQYRDAVIYYVICWWQRIINWGKYYFHIIYGNYCTNLFKKIIVCLALLLCLSFSSLTSPGGTGCKFYLAFWRLLGGFHFRMIWYLKLRMLWIRCCIFSITLLNIMMKTMNKLWDYSRQIIWWSISKTMKQNIRKTTRWQNNERCIYDMVYR